MTAPDPNRPSLVDPDWAESWGMGDGIALLSYSDGTWRVQHEHGLDAASAPGCTVAPALMIGQGHTIVSRDPLTIVASILCPDCGLHGFVTNGEWVPA